MKNFSTQHLLTNTSTEFLYLFSKGITQPPGNQHNCVNGDASEIHGSCGATAQTVEANLICSETQLIRTVAVVATQSLLRNTLLLRVVSLPILFRMVLVMGKTEIVPPGYDDTCQIMAAH